MWTARPCLPFEDPIEPSSDILEHIGDIERFATEARVSFGVQENIRLDLCLFQNRAKRSLRHIARMIWYRRVTLRPRIKPDLMASGRLPIKHEPARP